MTNFFHRNFQKIGFAIVCFLFFCIAYYINRNTPISSDDWAFFVAYQKNRIHSFSEIIASIKYFYLNVNGRSVANFVIMFFVYAGKSFFDFFNALMFASIGILIYLFSNIGESKKIKIPIIIASFMLIWFCVPSDGQTMFWFCGAVVYLWMAVLDLIFLFPFLNQLVTGRDIVKSDKIYIFLFFLAGILAGNSHELIAPIILGVTVLAIVSRNRREEISQKWSYAGAIGVLIGLVAQFVAPGNYFKITYTAETHVALFSVQSLRKLAGIFWWQEFLWVIVLGIGILFVANRIFFKNKFKIADKYMISLAVAAMLLNFMGFVFPYFPPRASFFSSIILIILVVRFLTLKDLLIPKYIVVLIFVPSLLFAIKDTIYKSNKLFIEYQKRDVNIMRQKSNGSRNILITRIKLPKDSKLMFDPIVQTDDHNSWASKFYEVQTIDLIK